jgi:hypothetical protein
MSERTTEIIERSLALHMASIGFAYVQPSVYEKLPGDNGVRQLIYIFKNPKRDHLLNADFGIRNDRAEEFSCAAIRRFGSKIFEHFQCGGPVDSTMRFSLADLNPEIWPIAIDGIASSPFIDRFVMFLNEELMSLSRSVGSVEQFLSFLIDDGHFNSWLACNGAVRAAQIVALSSQLGFEHARIRATLEPRKILIASGGGKFSIIRADPGAYIEELLRGWSKEGNWQGGNWGQS